mmetsp:Transcript_24678/g.58586  ORF Transcript_24678/g.58586 Transcript_24678/m.58586 type:complete len:330 (+) Transcript_24678:6290-7279(+)
MPHEAGHHFAQQEVRDELRVLTPEQPDQGVLLVFCTSGAEGGGTLPGRRHGARASHRHGLAVPELWRAPAAGHRHGNGAAGEQGAYPLQLCHRCCQLPGGRRPSGAVDHSHEWRHWPGQRRDLYGELQATGGAPLQLQRRLQHQEEEGASDPQREGPGLQDPRVSGYRGAGGAACHQLGGHGDLGHGHAASPRTPGGGAVPQERQQAELQLPHADAGGRQPKAQAHRHLREAALHLPVEPAGCGATPRGDPHRADLRAPGCSYAGRQHPAGGDSCWTSGGDLLDRPHRWSQAVKSGVLFPQPRLRAMLYRPGRCHHGWGALCPLRGHAV